MVKLTVLPLLGLSAGNVDGDVTPPWPQETQRDKPDANVDAAPPWRKYKRVGKGPPSDVAPSKPSSKAKAATWDPYFDGEVEQKPTKKKIKKSPPLSSSRLLGG